MERLHRYGDARLPVGAGADHCLPCVVWAENSRAFSSRTSDRPVLENIFSNMAMQKAITLAQIALYLITFLPGLSYPIFELQGALILDWGFWVGIAIAFLCILMCEVYKFVCREQIKNFRERVRKQQEEEEQERLAQFARVEIKDGGKAKKQPGAKDIDGRQSSTEKAMGA